MKREKIGISRFKNQQSRRNKMTKCISKDIHIMIFSTIPWECQEPDEYECGVLHDKHSQMTLPEQPYIGGSPALFSRLGDEKDQETTIKRTKGRKGGGETFKASIHDKKNQTTRKERSIWLRRKVQPQTPTTHDMIWYKEEEENLKRIKSFIFQHKDNVR